MAVGLAIHTFFRLGLRAGTVLNGLAFLNNQDLLFAAVAQHLNSGKDPGRAGAYDDYIILHLFLHLVYLTCRQA